MTSASRAQLLSCSHQLHGFGVDYSERIRLGLQGLSGLLVVDLDENLCLQRGLLRPSQRSRFWLHNYFGRFGSRRVNLHQVEILWDLLSYREKTHAIL